MMTLTLSFLSSMSCTVSVKILGVIKLDGASINILAKFWPLALCLPTRQPVDAALKTKVG